ncbi:MULTISPECIES: MFS transporter [Mycobacteroides]|uniref:MFS transporter n=2 Tax=Mycobacteroides chelonae TaxID=1774 RepID=A0A1S1LK34_MYCCH|nr:MULTISPECIES: MFS transporter [Mycobacteroides]KRQ18505.1 multidrug transporter [Mycobacteroides sp. H003]KRQ29389.1 multidrug transporter [Mycobacteroides sp. H092]KRQ41909.1 multidrug transporter [Mycobacteroides sp. H101]KRQ50233.1 multidrug transporter [Mycobacteroides sp. H063]KRQ56463.1 multidrug transporter [Mycobacteroides sp. HXVII]
MNLAVRHVFIACAALLVARLTMLDHGLAAVWGVDRGDDALGTIEWATVAGDVVAVVTLLVFARLGNHIRPTTFLAAGLVILGLSTAGSLIPGSATLLAWVMLVSALGAGLTMVASMLIVLHSTPRKGRGLSLGFWVAMYPVAMLAGEVLDINSPQNWRPITYGILAATVVVLIVVLTQPHREFVGTFDTFDLVGALLWLVGVSALAWLLIDEASPVRAVILAIIALAAFGALFAQTRRRGSAALIAAEVLTRPVVLAALLAITVLTFLVRFADFDHAAMWWSLDREQAPSDTPAFALFASGLVLAPAAGYLIDTGKRTLVAALGVALLVAGVVAIVIELRSATTEGGLVLGLLLSGAGIATLAVYLFHAVFHGVSPVQLTVVGGLAVTASALGAVLGEFVRQRAEIDLLTGYGLTHPSVFADIVGLIVVLIALLAGALLIVERRRHGVADRESADT